MKTRIYDVCKDGQNRIELFKVLDNGQEYIINLWVYREGTEHPTVWGRDVAIKEAKEFAEELKLKEEKKMEKKELLFEIE